MWGTSFHTCRRVAAELLYLRHIPRLWWQWEGAPGWLNWGTPVLGAVHPSAGPSSWYLSGPSLLSPGLVAVFWADPGCNTESPNPSTSMGKPSSPLGLWDAVSPSLSLVPHCWGPELREPFIARCLGDVLQFLSSVEAFGWDTGMQPGTELPGEAYGRRYKPVLASE